MSELQESHSTTSNLERRPGRARACGLGPVHTHLSSKEIALRWKPPGGRL